MIFHQENCNNLLICFSSLSLHKVDYITPPLWTFQWLLIIENPEIHRGSCNACSAASGLHFSPWASLFMPLFTVFLPTWLHFCFPNTNMQGRIYPKAPASHPRTVFLQIFLWSTTSLLSGLCSDFKQPSTPCSLSYFSLSFFLIIILVIIFHDKCFTLNLLIALRSLLNCKLQEFFMLLS